NWNTDQPLNEWYGVTTNAEGRVTELDLAFFGLKGALPPSFGDLTNLTNLNLSYGNEITSLPESFGQITKLISLNLDGNPVNNLPASFGQLINLTTLNLTSNGLTSLPESFGQLNSLDDLTLEGNPLTSLPESFGQLSNLTTLKIKYSTLTSLPESFGQLSKLAILDLTYNSLTNLPASFGQLTNLISLDLSYNTSLTSLPVSFGQLTSLTNLNLFNNQLTSLPESIGQLQELKTLDLKYNGLSFAELEKIPEGFKSDYENYYPQTVDKIKTIHFLENNSIQLQADITKTENDQYYWYKKTASGSTEITSNERIEINGDQIKINNLTAADEGEYFYQVTNTNFEIPSNTNPSLVPLSSHIQNLKVATSETEKTYGETDFYIYLNNEDYQLSSSETSVAEIIKEDKHYKVNIKRAGKTTLTVQNPDEEWELTIHKAPLTITAHNKSIIYGDPLPTFDGVVEGLQYDDKAPKVTYTTTAPDDRAKVVEVGYSITIEDENIEDVDGKLSNYEIIKEEGVLMVNKALLNVTSNNKNTTYGEDLPKFEGTAKGFKYGDEQKIEISYEVDNPIHPTAGQHPIHAKLDDPEDRLKNYTLEVKEGSLTVDKATLEITTKDKVKIYGEVPSNGELSSFDGTVTGLKFDDKEDMEVYYSVNDLSVGSHRLEVKLKGPEDQVNSYALNYVNESSITIHKAPLTIRVNDKTLTFFGENIELDAEFEGLQYDDYPNMQYSYHADGSSPTGEYPIIAEILGPEKIFRNYEIELINGTLTIGLITGNEEEISQQELELFPNPTFHTLQIKWEKPQAWNLSVIDLSGRVLFQKESKLPSNHYQLETNKLSAGHYFLKIQLEDKLLSLPFIKQ
ncbi:MBG domain-containing protein, partial [Xanthovirga aplysinae]|uniref:MBG domain-containing protein n=1 Tax=Xanthovirga aplysinae TaxID=2529853 RepID=UPI0012BD1DF4